MGRSWDGEKVAYNTDVWREALRVTAQGGYLVAFGGARTHHRMACAIEDAGWEIRDCIMWLYGTGFPKGKAQLKPAHEPIVLARKAGKLRAFHVGECRVPGAKPDTTRGAGGQNGRYGPIGAMGRIIDDGAGRWPANVAHDGSDEVMEAFAAFGSKGAAAPVNCWAGTHESIYNKASGYQGDGSTFYADSGTAARFFYCAKASPSERAGARHPTIKPLSLMEWLVKLVTPPGGIVLDPFAGSGTTGLAARNTGRRAVLIEREAEYVEMIRQRLDHNRPV